MSDLPDLAVPESAVPEFAVPESAVDDALARLVERLPAHLMARDAESGALVGSLLQAVAAELALVEADLDDLYDAWFVETCPEWVLPYLADLVGVPQLPPDLGTGAGLTRRAFVANTVAYRRRKGTVAALEQVARDVTGWPARVVEFYRLTAIAAHVNHVRLDRPAVASLRDAARLDLTALDAAGPAGLVPGLDPLAHTAEVRRIGSRRGRYGLTGLGVFLYPLRVNEVPWAPAGRSADGFTADPLGRPTPLFAVPDADPGIEHLSTEADLPVPLRPRRLLALLAAARAGDRDAASLPIAVRVGASEAPLPPQRLRVCGLEDLDPTAGPEDWQVMVDPRTGGIRGYRGGVAADPGDLLVRYAYGSIADVGAGTYDRSDIHDRVLAADRYDGRHEADAQIAVRAGAPESERLIGSVSQALARAAEFPAGGTRGVCIEDSSRYVEDLVIEVPQATRLVLVAARWPDRLLGTGEVLPGRPGVYATDGARPHLRGTLTVSGGPGSSVVLDGLLVEGDLVVAPGDLGALTISQCTVTGQVSVQGTTAATNGDLHVTAVRAVLGSVTLGGPVPTASFTDSVVGGGSGGGAPDPVLTGPAAHTSLEGCTVLGDVTVRSLDASSCVFDGAVVVSHRQVGCLRYSCTGPGSQTPRRFRCVPASEDGPPVAPVFASRDPASPVHASLAATCPEAIRLGGEDGGEMGVHHHLFRPRRVEAARTALAPYVPVRMEIAILGS